MKNQDNLFENAIKLMVSMAIPAQIVEELPRELKDEEPEKEW